MIPYEKRTHKTNTIMIFLKYIFNNIIRKVAKRTRPISFGMISPENKSKKGYAVLELLFYIALFAVLSLVVINSMIVMVKAFKETNIKTELIESASVMERMSREVRQAYDINSINATDLKLNTKDNSGNNKTVEFLLSGSNIKFLENDVLTGNLNSSTIAITALAFTQINTNKGKAVKISLTLISTNDTLSRAVDFYDTVVLRGAY